jgi:PST family polysaccharide transporter
LQDDIERYRSYVRTTLLGLFGLALPATLLLLLDAKWVILVLFGPQWDRAVPFFQILTIGAYVGSYGMVTRWLFLAEGRTGEQLRLSLMVTSLTVTADAIGAFYSPMGVAVGFTIATVVLSFPSVWYCLRKSPLRWRDYLGAVWRPTVASLLAAGAFLIVREFRPWMARPVFQVLVDSVIYGALYVLWWLALPGGRAAASKVLSQLRLLLPS